MFIVTQKKLFDESVNALAAYIAARIVLNAQDNEEDATTYAVDDYIVGYYAKELFSAVSKKLPEAVKHLASLPPNSIE